MHRFFNGLNKPILGWALYDWANSAFATTVIVAFFPLFFKQFWSADNPATESTWQFGVTNALASLLIMVLSPVLGSIADKGGAQKRFLLFFTLLGVLGTASLSAVEKGHWQLAAVIYALAMVGFSGGITFYNALLVSVAEGQNVHRVSALGFALGYLGGGLLFVLNLWMLLSPGTFGFQDATEAVRTGFITVAAWWALFSLPLFLFVEEPRLNAPLAGAAAIRAGIAELKHTAKEIRKLPFVGLFLLAYFLYIDAADTIGLMAVDYALAMGFDSSLLMKALLITQFVSFPAALGFGWAGARLGPKAGIFTAILVYTVVTVFAYFMREAQDFYWLAAAVGLVQGGIQSLSRSLYATIIPRNRSGEFFGIFNMWSKMSVVIGPWLVGWVSVATGNPRLSILALLGLFALGAFFLYFIDIAKATQAARAFEQEQ